MNYAITLIHTASFDFVRARCLTKCTNGGKMPLTETNDRNRGPITINQVSQRKGGKGGGNKSWNSSKEWSITPSRCENEWEREREEILRRMEWVRRGENDVAAEGGVGGGSDVVSLTAYIWRSWRQQSVWRQRSKMKRPCVFNSQSDSNCDDVAYFLHLDN